MQKTRAQRSFWLAAAALGVLVAACSMAVLGGTEPEGFVGDFEDGAIDETFWKVHSEGECNIAVVESPVRAGRYAARFDTEDGGRCELIPWVGSSLLRRLERDPIGSERWYGFSVFLPEGWSPNASNEVIAQWHASPDVFFGETGRRPPLSLRLIEESWRISVSWDARLISRSASGVPPAGAAGARRLWVGPYETGRWTDWVFHVKWSYGADGLTEVWKNDELVVSDRGPNAYNDFRGLYLKLGVYHPGVQRTVYHDEVRIGGMRANYGNIAPGAGSAR